VFHAAPWAFCFPTNAVAKVYFQLELEYDALLTVTANGLQSVHSCKMKWQLCDGTLDTMIGPCPWAHSVGGLIGDSADDQLCGAFIVSDPLSVHPTSFQFAWRSIFQSKWQLCMMKSQTWYNTAQSAHSMKFSAIEGFA
jgi:hypothetical protein